MADRDDPPLGADTDDLRSHRDEIDAIIRARRDRGLPAPSRFDVPPRPHPPDPRSTRFTLNLSHVITIVLAVIGYTVTGIWWAASLSQRINDLEVELNKQYTQSRAKVELQRRDDRMDYITRELESLERRVERLEPGTYGPYYPDNRRTPQ